MQRVLIIVNALTSLLVFSIQVPMLIKYMESKQVVAFYFYSFHSYSVISNFNSHSQTHTHTQFDFCVGILIFFFFFLEDDYVYIGTTKWSRSNEKVKKCNLTWLLVIVKSMRGSSNNSSCQCRAENPMSIKWISLMLFLNLRSLKYSLLPFLSHRDKQIHTHSFITILTDFFGSLELIFNDLEHFVRSNKVYFKTDYLNLKYFLRLVNERHLYVYKQFRT